MASSTLMDISYKNGDKSFEIKGLDKTVIYQKNIEEIIKLLKYSVDEPHTILPLELDEKKIKELTKDTTITGDVKREEERPVVRKRLPNEVDLSDVELKKAVTTEPMLRCPKCGQSAVIVVVVDENHVYLMRKETDDTKDTYTLIAQLKSNDDIKAVEYHEDKFGDKRKYHEEVMKMDISKDVRNEDLNVDMNTSIYCPVCCTFHKYSEWIECFKHPLDFGFETEHLCDVCGGEVVEQIDKDKKKILHCEKCGYNKSIK